MLALVASIHAFVPLKAWTAGTSLAVTKEKCLDGHVLALRVALGSFLQNIGAGRVGQRAMLRVADGGRLDPLA